MHQPASNRPALRAEQEHPLWFLLHSLASLKLTLVLLSLAMLLILFGTLAQAKIGMWDVLERYFKSFGVWVELQHLVPRTWVGEMLGPEAAKAHDRLQPWQGFPFPGGALIGLGMIVNLTIAHLLKFQIRARGVRLFTGLLSLVFAVGLTWAIIALGQYRQGLAGEPLVSWEMLAKLINVSGVAITVALYLIAGSLGAQAYAEPGKLAWPKAIIAFTAALVSTLCCVLLYVFRDDLSALRILWQLIQGTMAGIVLLGACWLLFEKRAGIVLLHGGLGLMMFGEYWVTQQAREQQMQILEGETAVYAHDIRTAELAIVEQLPGEERHTVVPAAWLAASANLEQVDAASFQRVAGWRQIQRLFGGSKGIHPGRISDDRLPFDLEVLAWYKNSELVPPDAAEGQENLATRGAGLRALAKEKPVNSGAASDGDVDLPAAYVRVLNKETGEPLGVYLASLLLGLEGRGETLRLGDRKFSLTLRFEREYKPYQVKLHDFRREDYPGSNTPRAYEAHVQMIDPRHGVDREVRISMNNPFRYLGETFYQSSFRPADKSGRETTVLQVVTNSGWLIPYVSCMIVLVGLVFQFNSTLLQFLAGELAEPAPGVSPEKAPRPAILAGLEHRPAVRPKAEPTSEEPLSKESWWGWFVPSRAAWVVLLLGVVLILSGLRTPRSSNEAFDLHSFGQIPVMSGGRAKPLDSLARETMLAMSNDVKWKDSDGQSQLALKWLLETIAMPERARKHRVIRLESNEVAEALGLELQKDLRYSFADFQDRQEKVMKQFEQLSGKEETDYTVYDNQLLQLDKRLQARLRAAGAFEGFDLAGMLASLGPASDDAEQQRRIGAAAEMIAGQYRKLDQSQAPLAVPFENAELSQLLGGKRWLPLTTALAMFDLQKLNTRGAVEEEVPLVLWREIIAAYQNQQPAAFNTAVGKYLDWTAMKKHADFTASRIQLESRFNQFNPFGWTQGLLLYLFSAVLSLVSLLAWRTPLSKAAFWLLVLTFALHTAALAARMYIAGRPPVTNLYSSAVFIGWAVVLFGILLEAWFRLSVGNLLAAVGGFASLRIALALSFEGDTIGVMQAVLDTQFWLATHVVCITLGYAATFVAGLLGICFIFEGVLTTRLVAERRKLLARMIYGVVCFALLLSFFGTVLGGLWADDSWGRFWGWDPKENGALLIVLWNAIILHARWAGLARERGLATLAVFGNIVTSWSWFGTNQLGVGLHSYGFTQGTLIALAADLMIHLAIIAAGSLPRSWWQSYRAEQTPLATN